MNHSISLSMNGLELLSLVAVCGISIAGFRTASAAEKPDVSRSSESPAWDSSEIEKLNRPLGRPLGDPVKTGYAYTRSFEHVDVSVNVETKQTQFNWHDAPANSSVLPKAAWIDWRWML